MRPEDVGSTPGSVTFPPPGFDGVVALVVKARVGPARA